MTAIAYDYPIKDLIAGLNATGHVTHTQYRKDMVTLHHNGGRLSHEGVLNVWKTRPASAHFDIDGGGHPAQYVKANEYAWACGNTEGNRRSISIEMANSSLSPNWEVAEITWRGAARLAGWLFARVIGTRPTRNNLVMHSHWKATLCAGPHIGRMYNAILDLAGQHYDAFVRGTGGPAPSPPPSSGGKSVADVAVEVIAGKWGNGDDRRRRLEGAGYDYDEVQTEVNRRLGAGAPGAEPRKSIDQLAREVIAGHWGNGTTRRNRLEGAGYNYAAVQRRVNELL
jgi:hypothetical protein